MQLNTLHQKGECWGKKSVIQGRGRAYHRCTVTKQQVIRYLIFFLTRMHKGEKNQHLSYCGAVCVYFEMFKTSLPPQEIWRAELD